MHPSGWPPSVAERPPVALAECDKRAIEVFEQRHDDSSAAAERLTQIADRGRSMVADERTNELGRARDAAGGHHQFRADLDHFTCIDQKPQRPLRQSIGSELL